MGFDVSDFEETVSEHLVCSLCHGVLENPVQTPCDHLFCEAELLEWLLVSNKCPLDNGPLDPTKITRPRSRIWLSGCRQQRREAYFRGCRCVLLQPRDSEHAGRPEAEVLS
jgi:hypothetical protein